jgi:DNA-binding response OmpR family regulator
VIAITSASANERIALLALFDASGWPAIECRSVRATLRSLQRHQPRVVVTRHRLDDGFSDDIFATLGDLGPPVSTKFIVLLDAGVASDVEVRQLSLGADCVLRNPIRTDVLIAYVRKYLKASPLSSGRCTTANAAQIAFCGGRFAPIERTLHHGRHRVSLTPREADLVEMLAHSPGVLTSYERLYAEILGRRFRGDTSNMRVLLGKLATSCRSIGISIRPHVHVIPKTGYHYAAPEGA